MDIKKRSRGIRLKIVLIYCLLVFIATTIIGAFIMSQTEDYLRGVTRDNMRNAIQEGTLLTSLQSYRSLKENSEAIQASVDAWGGSLEEELFVVDSNFNIIAANNTNAGKSALGILDEALILEGLSGGNAESETSLITAAGTIPVLNMVFPIESSGQLTGVVYLRADLSAIGDAVSNSRNIFAKAMAIAFFVTVVLGYFIAKSITEPINHVTEKAQLMAAGDFSQEVRVKSDDEIGQLAEMFNLLRLELNKTLSQISNEKSKLETVLRHMADGLIAMDANGKIIHANQAAMDILKTTPEQVDKLDYDTLIEGILKEEMSLEALRKKCEKEACTETFERDGYIYNVRYDKFNYENGKEAGLIMIIQDITERHKLENMQMDFVANVSHELKTPLTTIKSYTETLLEGNVEDPETTHKFLEIIDSETDRMTRLVRDLLQLSRLEYKQEQMHKQDTNLTELVKAAVTKVTLQAKGRNQHLNSIFDEQVVASVFVDKDRIEQVLLNILINAIKYTENGGRIDIDLQIIRNEVHVTVKDNGIGIPAEDISRVFERFFRVDKARSRALGGTGLGLAISKQIIEEHDGKISVESKEGQGTKVTITLPLISYRGKRDIE